MASKVYTKKGDKGYTSVMGTRNKLPKNNNRLKAIGSVDELNSFVGLVRAGIDNYVDNYQQNVLERFKKHNEVLSQIQNNLFDIGAKLADVTPTVLEVKSCDSNESGDRTPLTVGLEELENSMDEMSRLLEPLKNFILPAGNLPISYCHVARTVCRRAERKIVSLNNEFDNSDPYILKYINRLSDYFFVLARMLCQDMGIQEVIWISQKIK